MADASRLPGESAAAPSPPHAAPDRGAGVAPGAGHYRAFVGAPQTYDIFGHMQFSLMTLLGLREENTLLDIGCGSLRAGKLFILYLLPDRYFGIEPEQWLVEEGIKRELGDEIIARKRPRFLFDRSFSCTDFNVGFDFVIAQSIFSHASLAQIRRCLSQASAAMHARSLFAASFVEGEEDYAGETWVYPDTIRFRAATIERVAAESGLACRRLDWFHIGGQAWFLFFLPGIEPEVEQLAALNQAFPLQQELWHYRQRADRLERIEKHPLFRLATRMLHWMRRGLGR